MERGQLSARLSRLQQPTGHDAACSSPAPSEESRRLRRRGSSSSGSSSRSTFDSRFLSDKKPSAKQWMLRDVLQAKQCQRETQSLNCSQTDKSRSNNGDKLETVNKCMLLSSLKHEFLLSAANSANSVWLIHREIRRMGGILI